MVTQCSPAQPISIVFHPFKFLAGIQIVGMSATIGNLKELAKYLDADIYHKDFRPVELTEYIKCGRDLLEIKKDAIDIESSFVHVKTVNFNVSWSRKFISLSIFMLLFYVNIFQYNVDVLKMDPDQITGLVSEIIPDNSCLIFCPTKKNCENVASMLRQILSKWESLLPHKLNMIVILRTY